MKTFTVVRCGSAESVDDMPIRGRARAAEPESGRKMTAEQQLLCAVLIRAVQDANGSQPKERREARAWLRSLDNSDVEWSFAWVLKGMDWPPCSRWRIWRFVQAGKNLDLLNVRMRARA